MNQSSIIHNSPKLGTMQMSLKWWMVENLLLAYKGIWFSNANERTIYTCNNTNELQRYYVEQKKTDAKDHRVYNFIYMKCSKSTNL